MNNLRRYILEIIKVNEKVDTDAGKEFGGTSSDYSAQTIDDEQMGDVSSSYEGPLVTVKGNKKYLGKPRTGLSPDGYWSKFRSDLESHINSAYPELGLKIDNLGVSRDLKQAADPGDNKARVAGSKHGGGFAQDVYFHTDKYGKYTNFRKDNKVLAKDQKLVDSIVDFIDKYPDLRWGGAFGSGGSSLEKGKAPIGRGVLEFHHFEFKGKEIPKFFAQYKDELAKIGTEPEDLTSTKGLGKLYTALAESNDCDNLAVTSDDRALAAAIGNIIIKSSRK